MQQITLVSSGDTISDVLDRFEANFFNWVEIQEKFSRWAVPVSGYLLECSIRELKAMTDFLANAFNVAGLDAPKRNSKVSLADWIVGVLLSAREVVEASGAIADQVVDSPSSEVEVMEPEEKPVYTISIVANGNLSEERVSSLPPYLLDRKGNLLKKFWHRSCDAGYAEITSEQLFNIAVESGLVIKLMTENLEVSQACICGDPPPFIIVDGGGVYKRDRLKQRLVVRYAQVVSEYLSNIVIL
jgi:hypothetical protein